MDYGETEKAEPNEIPANGWVLELEDVESGTARILERHTFATRASKSTKNRFRRGDVLYGKLRPYLNKVVIADSDGFCTTEIIPLRSTPLVTSNYLFWWLKHPRFLDYAASVSHGLNMPRLGTDAGRAAPFVLAPIAEQQRIVARLESLQARSRRAREALDAVPALLEKLRQSILAAAFRGDLTKDWRAKHPDAEAAIQLPQQSGTARVRRGVPTKVIMSDVVQRLDAPDSWKKTSIAALLMRGALIDVKDGNHGTNHPRSDEFTEVGLPFITAAQVRNWVLDYDGAPKVAGPPLKKLQVGFAHSGDVVFTHKGTIGRVGLCVRDCVLTPQTTYYRVNDSIFDRHFLMYQLASFAFSSQYSLVMSQTTRNYVPISEQYRFFLLVPPLAEQRVIAARLSASMQRVDQLRLAATHFGSKLVGLERAVLAKAFRGELVPQDPDDEPAETMLARLRSANGNGIDNAKSQRRERLARERSLLVDE